MFKLKIIISYHPVSPSLCAVTANPNIVPAGLLYSTWLRTSMLKLQTVDNDNDDNNVDNNNKVRDVNTIL
jgi:hypothetical protein